MLAKAVIIVCFSIWPKLENKWFRLITQHKCKCSTLGVYLCTVFLWRKWQLKFKWKTHFKERQLQLLNWWSQIELNCGLSSYPHVHYSGTKQYSPHNGGYILQDICLESLSLLWQIIKLPRNDNSGRVSLWSGVVPWPNCREVLTGAYTNVLAHSA